MEQQLTGKFEDDWALGLELWKILGRVEDLPRDVRVPKYSPSEGKIFGQKLALKYKANFKQLIEKLGSIDNCETLCAFEILEYICWEYGPGHVPEELLALSCQIPVKILEELPYDPEFENFSGSTCGTLFNVISLTYQGKTLTLR